MKDKEQEYKEIFLAEALDNFEEINRLLTSLEKNLNDKNTIHALFRITHTLKGNAMGLGFGDIAELSHVMEDIFNEVKKGSIALDEELFNSLFKANDKLGELIQALKTDKKVAYKGIKTKLEVYLKNALNNTSPAIEKDGDNSLPEIISEADKIVREQEKNYYFYPYSYKDK